MVKELKEALRNEITWPCNEEWEELLKTSHPLLPPSLKGCITVVDGSEFQISKPAKEPFQHNHFSVKKKQHSPTFSSFCFLMGELDIYHQQALVPVINHYGIPWNSEKI
jgi:hypothetical protein